MGAVSKNGNATPNRNNLGSQLGRITTWRDTADSKNSAQVEILRPHGGLSMNFDLPRGVIFLLVGHSTAAAFRGSAEETSIPTTETELKVTSFAEYC
jgi:hypothetical protein